MISHGNHRSKWQLCRVAALAASMFALQASAAEEVRKAAPAGSEAAKIEALKARQAAARAAKAAQAAKAAESAANAPQTANRAECLAPRQAAGTLGEATSDAIRRASELVAQKKPDEAIDKLKPFETRGQAFDKASVQYNLGVAYSDKQQFLQAAQAFENALAFDVLPKNQSDQLQFNLGQLYVAGGEHDKGIAALKKYMAESCTVPTPEAHMFLASALAERKLYDQALPEVETALAQSKKPRENWIQFKLGVQYELKQYQAAAETLLDLIAMQPEKPEYWKQLSGVLLEMDDKDQSLAVMALAERQGFLQRPADIMNLYNIYMVIDVPMKGGQLLERALAEGKVQEDEKTLESIANAWINARESEKAELALKKAASVADKGEYYFKLGAMYGEQERWKESKEMLQLALQKGGLKKPGDVWFRVALADYRMNDLRAAIGDLQQAQKYEETKRQAGDWMQSLSAELAAQQSQTASLSPD